MDDCYHYGYNHSNALEGRNTVQYINESIYKVSEKGKEIVISGCQSAMLVREENYLYLYPMEQHSYLLAFQPDAIVLCINIFDELNFIGRTIKYLEGAVECKVVAIVVFPGMRKSSLSGNITSNVEEKILMEKINEVNKEFGIDVFILGDKNSMDNLTDLVIDYFTE